MKKILALVLVISFAFVLVGCAKGEKFKKDIFNLVEENYEAIIQACQDKDADALYAINGIKKVDIVDGYVLIYYMGAGFGPSTQYYGFYYTEENRPVAVDGNQDILCDTEELTPEGNGYQYIDRSYNIFYTEHIKGNIYFYSTYY